MTRRSPPTALRLVQGPIPARGNARHTLPSVPRPTFQPPATLPRIRSRSPTAVAYAPSPPPLTFPSPSSSSDSLLLRGPWDHSRSISVPMDMEKVLAPLKPVAVSPGW